ncbi:MAG: hypothetical protein H0U95_11315 [Bacteroidetes bacterium]|nr:hypothetical protein [Bacteroidota bacterium]
MKYLIIPFVALLFSCSNPVKDTKTTENAYGTGEFILPKTWDKGFSISLYTGGGMINESENILFSADSCFYHHSVNNVDSTKRFTLTPKEKEEILTKLGTFKVGAIENITTPITYDKETNSMCFTNLPQESYCLETSATKEIKESDVPNFNGAYSYLWQLALTKSKK